MTALKILIAAVVACGAALGVAWGQAGPAVTATSIVSNTPVQIIGQNPSRKMIQICNTGATNGVWIWPGALSPTVSAYEIPPVTSNLTACYSPPTGSGTESQKNLGAAWNATGLTGTVSVFEF